MELVKGDFSFGNAFILAFRSGFFREKLQIPLYPSFSKGDLKTLL
jgi:hypothetical protein